MKNNKFNQEIRNSIQQEYNDWAKISRPINNNLLILFIIISAGIIYFFKNTIFSNLSWIVIFYCSWLIANRTGHNEGYMQGYRDGILYGEEKNSEMGDEEDEELVESFYME